MTHQVLSRKYRPQTFDQVVGQDHVARILASAIQSDRVGHAYLFVGPRGVGKTTSARLFARALNCSGRDIQKGVEPCGTCASCIDIAAGSDLDVVEMDAASNNHVEDVRALREQVGYATARSENRIWIVDEVHMLSLPAFNAFLKTLEEPPRNVKFVFCTTEEHKLPDTFRSRCQRVEFRPLSAEAMAGRLTDLAAREEMGLEAGVADAVAGTALGGMRDAESLLEQLMAACPEGTVRLADFELLSGRASAERLDLLTAAVAAGDAAEALIAVDDCLANGCKPGVLLDQWLECMRVGLIQAAAAKEGTGLARLSRAIDVLLQKRAHLRGGADGVLIAQVTAVELARLPDARDLDRLVDALRGAAGAPAAEPASAGAPRAAPAGSASGPGQAAAAAPATRAREPGGTGASGTSRRQGDEPSPSRPCTCEDIAAGWGGFLRALAERDTRLAEAASQLTPKRLTDGVLALRLERGVEGVRATFSRREIQIAFGQVARTVFGTALRAEVEEDEEDVRQLEMEGPDLRDHPLVQLVTDVTQGRLLNIERIEAADSGDDATH